MIRRVSPIAQAGAYTDTFFVSGGKVSHLVLIQDTLPLATDYITIKLSSPHHNLQTLVPRISMLALNGISDIEGGASGALQTALNAATGITDYVDFVTSIDLGHLDLEATNSKLEILLEVSTSMAHASLSVCDNRPAEHDYLCMYTLTSQMVSEAQAVDRVYLYYATGTDTPITATAWDDLSIQIKDATSQDLCSAVDAVGWTSAFGEIEGASPRNCLVLFADHDITPGAVSWTLSGSDALPTVLALIVRSKVMEEVRLHLATQNLVAIQAKKQMSHHPNIIAALHGMGLVPHPLELQQAHAVAGQRALKATTMKARIAGGM